LPLRAYTDVTMVKKQQDVKRNAVLIEGVGIFFLILS
jgi:hypothetical protein